MGLLIFGSAITVLSAAALKMSGTRNFKRRMAGDIRVCSSGKSSVGSCRIREKLNTHPSEIGVFSISLFGDMEDPDKRSRYFDPLLKSAERVKGLIDGWYLRVYVAPSLSKSLIDLLIALDAEVYVMENDPVYFEGSMWRFLPAGEDIAFATLDADDEITTKYGGLHSLSSLIEKWMKTDRKFFQRALFHINILVPISAGMWGSRGRAIPDIEQRIERYCADWFGCDEAFLTKEVWPEFQKHGVYRTGNPAEFVVMLAIVVASFISLNYVLYELCKS